LEKSNGLQKALMVLVIALMLVYLGRNSIYVGLSESSLSKKIEVVSFVDLLVSEREDYNISFDMEVGGNPGYKYILEYNNLSGSGKYEDTLIQMVSPKKSEGAMFFVNNVGVKVPEEFLLAK
jgi:hypothetical protein